MWTVYVRGKEGGIPNTAFGNAKDGEVRKTAGYNGAVRIWGNGRVGSFAGM